MPNRLQTFENNEQSQRTNHKKIAYYLLALIIIFIAIVMVVSARKSLDSDKIRATTAQGRVIELEIADTEAERKIGLMNRRELANDSGMLFVFDDATSASCFWMKNTYIPLDMVWLDASKNIIHVYENATPLSETSICPPVNGAYVIEVNAGEASNLGMVVGSQIKF